MPDKHCTRIFAFSLMITGVIAVVLGLSNLLEWPMPDWAVRLLGVLALIMLPILCFSFVRTYLRKK